MSMAKYTEGITSDGTAILKDGHTMMAQDIVADLNRKSFLEQNKLDNEEKMRKLQFATKCLLYTDPVKSCQALRDRERELRT